ncbi:hypothetical protein CONLIGDRAFT_704257 [Coniochaeta ligniaria NRRL 30616]|uniref:Uncharacterized protein n=1 Tax=Coniochaeta ligniaria NRRL 30616 TaxID=1408157 RepID=A0A1J7INB9_9PEZI|nr:hypothetical protein CONLIGDRAFT_704257 [Coniochaeta ligniaria NRRL 30616]
MPSSSTNPGPEPCEPCEPYPTDAHTIHDQICAPRKPPLTKTMQCPGPSPPPPHPPPHSRRTVALLTGTGNRVLLQAACYLAVYHGEDPPPTGCPISLQDPLHPLLQALRKAEEAYHFALEWKRFELMAKAQLFRGHAYRAMGMWDLAYEAYLRAASYPMFAADKSEEGLEALTRLCAEMGAGKKPSGSVREETGGERRKAVVRGLFRCGTFGDLGARGRDDASVSLVQERRTVQQLDQAERAWEDQRVVGDGEDDEAEYRSGTGKGDDDYGHGDGAEDETGDESEIDWIAIGSREASMAGSPGLKLSPRPGFPPLRSARGRLVPRRKLWTTMKIAHGSMP